MEPERYVPFQALIDQGNLRLEQICSGEQKVIIYSLDSIQVTLPEREGLGSSSSSISGHINHESRQKRVCSKILTATGLSMCMFGLEYEQMLATIEAIVTA